MHSLQISSSILDLANEAEKVLAPTFAKIDKICLQNSAKVLASLHSVNLSATDFSETTGYGYFDNGRDKLEKVYCQIFHA